MELKDHAGTTRFALHPVRYEFESVNGDPDDYDWLVIDGNVLFEGQAWSFREPCLDVLEADAIAGWLDRVAGRREPTVDVHADDYFRPSLDFLEPNLGFSVRSYGDDSAIVRVHLDLEALPDDRRERADDDPFWIEIEITLQDAASAAAEWLTELAPFPKRLATPRRRFWRAKASRP